MTCIYTDMHAKECLSALTRLEANFVAILLMSFSHLWLTAAMQNNQQQAE